MNFSLVPMMFFILICTRSLNQYLDPLSCITITDHTPKNRNKMATYRLFNSSTHVFKFECFLQSAYTGLPLNFSSYDHLKAATEFFWVMFTYFNYHLPVTCMTNFNYPTQRNWAKKEMVRLWHLFVPLKATSYKCRLFTCMSKIHRKSGN